MTPLKRLLLETNVMDPANGSLPKNQFIAGPYTLAKDGDEFVIYAVDKNIEVRTNVRGSYIVDGAAVPVEPDTQPGVPVKKGRKS